MTLSEAQAFARHDLERIRAWLASKGWSRVSSKAASQSGGLVTVAIAGTMDGRQEEFALQVQDLEPDQAYRTFYLAAQAARTRAN